jgi:hypothetical protein
MGAISVFGSSQKSVDKIGSGTPSDSPRLLLDVSLFRVFLPFKFVDYFCETVETKAWCIRVAKGNGHRTIAPMSYFEYCWIFDCELFLSILWLRRS